MKNQTCSKNDSATAPSIHGSAVVDGAYQSMRRRILDNVWVPGYQALEQEITLQLGMRRTPVREVLIRLANEGLVEAIPRRLGPLFCRPPPQCPNIAG